jgi:HEPN domain-containing protein
MNNNQKEALRWFLQGRKDGETAKKNALNGDYEVACFLYQQAAEKVIKAFLYLKGLRPVMGHSTLKLAQKACRFDPSFKDVYDFCAELDIFYLPTRYPNGIPDGVPYEFFKESHAQKAETAFKSVFALIEPFFSEIS